MPTDNALLSNIVYLAIPLLVALMLHEIAHAWVAERLGDPTARLLGRITLNPLAHLDPIGTISLFLIGLGWAKPVPINPNNFHNRIPDEIQVALAGPFANFTLAVIAGALLHLPRVPEFVLSLGTIFVLINLKLMVFNLLPIPPLDGSRLLQLVISQETYLMFERYGLYILIVVIFLGSGVLGHLFDITVYPLARAILPGTL